MMEKKFAGVISVLFHPMLMPSYALVLFLNLNYFVSYDYAFEIKAYLVAFVFIMTFALPAILMFLLKKIKAIESFKMNGRKERMLPLAMMAVIYYITYYSLRRTGILITFNLFLLGTTIVTLFTLVVNMYTKISLHMVSMGGIAGALLGLLLDYPLDLQWMLYLLILLSGLVGYARLTVSNHTLRQVYNGFMMGFVIMLALFVM